MRATLTALALVSCAAVPAAAQTRASSEKALVVGRIETAKATGEAGLYDLDVIVLKVLSGKDPGEYAHVKVKAESDDLEGLMITLLIDSDVKLETPGQSWWTATDFPGPVCVPKKLVAGTAYKGFVAKSFEQDGERCVRL